MPLINLIQDQRLQIRQTERRARAYFFAFVGSTILGVTAYGFLLFLTEVQLTEKSRLEAATQKNAPITKETEANTRLVNQMAPRVQTLEDAQLTTDRWGRILSHLATNTPKGVWLTAVRASATDPEKPIEVSFVGIGDTQDRVGELIMRIQNSSDLEDVNLRFTQEKLVQQGRGIEFDVKAGIVGTVEKRAKNEDKEAS
jgi:Tfp pilus assembly protein PilN